MSFLMSARRRLKASLSSASSFSLSTLASDPAAAMFLHIQGVAA
jgi:hypothetical protein